jgi:hypothetical protein
MSFSYFEIEIIGLFSWAAATADPITANPSTGKRDGLVSSR